MLRVTSTGLLSGVRLTICWYALVHPGWVPRLLSRKLCKWIVEAISVAYKAFDLTSPLTVRAHSARSMATSKALLSRVSSKR